MKKRLQGEIFILLSLLQLNRRDKTAAADPFIIVHRGNFFNSSFLLINCR